MKISDVASVLKIIAINYKLGYLGKELTNNDPTRYRYYVKIITAFGNCNQVTQDITAETISNIYYHHQNEWNNYIAYVYSLLGQKSSFAHIPRFSLFPLSDNNKKQKRTAPRSPPPRFGYTSQSFPTKFNTKSVPYLQAMSNLCVTNSCPIASSQKITFNKTNKVENKQKKRGRKRKRINTLHPSNIKSNKSLITTNTDSINRKNKQMLSHFNVNRSTNKNYKHHLQQSTSNTPSITDADINSVHSAISNYSAGSSSSCSTNLFKSPYDAHRSNEYDSSSNYNESSPITISTGSNITDVTVQYAKPMQSKQEKIKMIIEWSNDLSKEMLEQLSNETIDKIYSELTGKPTTKSITNATNQQKEINLLIKNIVQCDRAKTEVINVLNESGAVDIIQEKGLEDELKKSLGERASKKLKRNDGSSFSIYC